MNVSDTLFPRRTQAPKARSQNRLPARRNRLRDLENAERLERRDLLAIDFARLTPGLFFVDTGQGRELTSEYEQIRITNNDAVNYDDLWVKADGFTGGVVGLSTNEDGIYHQGALNAGNSDDAYFYLAAQTATNVLQQHTVTVYDGDPREGGLTIAGASTTFNFTAVTQTIEASSNKVLSVSYDTTAPVLGGLVTMTVTGELGQATNDNALFTPALLLANFTVDTGSYDPILGIWTATPGDSFTAGESVIFTLFGTLPAGATGNLENTVTVSPP